MKNLIKHYEEILCNIESAIEDTSIPVTDLKHPHDFKIYKLMHQLRKLLNKRINGKNND